MHVFLCVHEKTWNEKLVKKKNEEISKTFLTEKK